MTSWWFQLSTHLKNMRSRQIGSSFQVEGKTKKTPWKFNIAPENKPSQKQSNLPTIILQGLC